jgi:hypothetical protein
MSPISTSAVLSPDELSEATRYLISTRDCLVEVLSCLSDPQWNFKPAADRWSIAETLEHVVVVEDRVHAIIDQLPSAPGAEPDRVNSKVEQIILAQVPNRSPKFKAPPHVCPSQQWSPRETLARFLENRTRTLELLVEAPSLRGHVVPHPFFGPWDGYQWILAAAAHSARHTDQILEVKETPGFPEAEAFAYSSLH